MEKGNGAKVIGDSLTKLVDKMQPEGVQTILGVFAKETQEFNVALRDSLNSFLNAYNRDKHYDIILSKAGDNILFADKRFDITQDVINGLNKRYKSTAKKPAEKKVEAKK